MHVRTATTPYDVATDTLLAQQQFSRAAVRLLILARVLGLHQSLSPPEDEAAAAADIAAADKLVEQYYGAWSGEVAPSSSASSASSSASDSPSGAALPAPFRPSPASFAGSQPFRRPALVYTNRFRDFITFTVPRFLPYATYHTSVRFESPTVTKIERVANDAAVFCMGSVEYTRRALTRLKACLTGTVGDLQLDAAPYSVPNCVAFQAANAAIMAAESGHGAGSGRGKGGKGSLSSSASSSGGVTLEARQTEMKRLNIARGLEQGLFVGHTDTMPLQVPAAGNTLAALLASSDVAALARLQRAATTMQVFAASLVQEKVLARMPRSGGPAPLVAAKDRIRFDASVDPVFHVPAHPPASAVGSGSHGTSTTAATAAVTVGTVTSAKTT